mmetsp:Transcript_41047/g.117993  ORF Transcript_41047/g.117993 Transcript_41047/m.117993 type:complete len:228 (-) Transcript_41047:212-895(-)|eukprot:CAMPEP_0176099450 /NCGR_PEP_ID=MMETSP0120_2-20121206/49873_1 /TAXON_ID=160619 /ORGANISM="Kryptoperidinium foliaceum, Strain CCMP 1326" /LENGTH=227 /DNA_ID=CAMNT_0017433479 /DNA_START=65 /DNA_END=748 /DNA_ORIENTATION=+
MGGNNVDEARSRVMLENLQQSDPEIDKIIMYSKFVVAYLLQHDGPNAGWRKANIEGPVYIVRRLSSPRYQLLVKNQYSQSDLLDNLHPDWELDCQKNYIFYKVEDPSKRIRGLWFYEDSDRMQVEQNMQRILEELRAPPPEPQTEPAPIAKAPTPAPPAPSAATPPPTTSNVPPPAPAPTVIAPTLPSVTVTPATLRKALKGMAEDEAFLRQVIDSLVKAQDGLRSG